MISFAIVKPEFNVHLVNNQGIIIDSTVNRKNSITGKDIIGSLAVDYIHSADTLHFIRKLERVINNGTTEFCEYRIKDQSFKAKINKLGADQIKIVEWNITGLDMQQVCQLPW